MELKISALHREDQQLTLGQACPWYSRKSVWGSRTVHDYTETAVHAF